MGRVRTQIAELGGAEAVRVSARALNRWRAIYLVEDNAARAVRRPVEGLARSRSGLDVVVRVHRITRSGISTVAEARYTPREPARPSKRNGKSGLALSLLDGLSLEKKSVIVAGPGYGNTGFFTGLTERNLNAVVEIRPGTRVTVGRGGSEESYRIRDLLEYAKWTRHKARLAGSPEAVNYAVAVIGRGRVGPHRGVLFAAQKGAIDGIHPGTIFALATRVASAGDLLQSVGWTRWIRPLVRRSERLVSLNGAESRRPRSKGSPLRANITLARLHDQAREAPDAAGCPPPGLRGELGRLSRPLNVVELFAGGGGMGLGFLLAGGRETQYRLVFSGKVHPIFVRTLIQNHERFREIYGTDEPLVPDDVAPTDLRLRSCRRQVTAKVREAGGADVLIGGPPCQGFSNANRNSWHTANPYNSLIDVFLEYVCQLRPKAFLLENVQGLHWTAKKARGGERTMLEHVQKRACAAGYDVFVKLLDAVWYGVPQYRSRFFVLGLDRSFGYTMDDFGPWGPFPRPTHGPGTARPFVTVRDAIGDLPAVGNGHAEYETRFRPVPARASNPFLRAMRHGACRNTVTDHVTSRHADYVIERYRRIPEGGNWRDIQDDLTNYADVRRTHSNIYRRLVWDEPSITIGHYRKSMLVHPSQHRGLSLREACRLQSFPDWFRFAGSETDDEGGLVHKQQQLANAVCPMVTQAIAGLVLEL